MYGAPDTPTGTYSATIQVVPNNGAAALSIPVTYTSGSGTGTSVSPNSFTLNYPNGPTSQAVSVTTTATDSYYSAVVSASAPWLYVGSSTSSCGISSTYVSSGSPLTVCLNTSVVGSYSSGTQGTVTVTGYPSGTQATVTVTLNGSSSGVVTISPSSVTFNLPAGTTAQQASTVYLTTAYSNVTYSAYTTTTTGAGWLSLTSYGGTLTGSNVSNSLTILANPGVVGSGTFSGTVYLTYSGAYSGTAQISVTLMVGSSTGTGTGGLVAPTSLAFAYQIGGSTQNTSSSILVNTTGSWSASVSSITTSQQWLQVATSGSAGQPVTVQVNAGGLAASTYSADITVTTTNSGSAVVPVTLTVSNSMVATTYPSTIQYGSYTPGTGVPNPASTVYVYASDGSAQTVTATPSAGWITATLQTASPTTPAAYLVTLNPSGLPNGLNTGSITFSVTNASDASWVVPVAIIVSGSTATSGPLTFSASSLAFNTTVGGTAASQTLTVSSTTAPNFTVSATSSSGWLIVTPNNQVLTLPQNLTVSVNTAGLAANSYTGSLNFLANGVTQYVPVTLSVGTSTGSGLTASPTSLSFSYTAGGAAPAGQAVTVTASNGGYIAFTAAASTSSGGSWLSLTVGSATQITTPSSFTASINTTGLAAGTYQGNIAITNATNGGVVNIPVTLTVTGAPAITASPTTLSFAYTAGGTAPGGQTVSVNGTGTFSASASSSGNWLSVSPTSGTSPTTVTVAVNPAGLTAGTYNGSVTVTGSGTSTGSTTVTVSLVVTAPLPTITQISNAASYNSGAISPGELITIFGTALGPATPVGLTLTPTGTVSTITTAANGSVQVLVNGIACPLIYVSSTQVSAVVPYAVSIFQTAQVYVSFLGQSSNAIEETVATTAPGLFTANSSGTGPGAILNQNGSPNSPSNPAAKGSVVTLYVTGEGQTSPAGVTGSVTQALATPPYTPAPLLAVAVLINGGGTTIQFAGEAPAIIAGVMQVNVVIPPGTPTGAMPVSVSIGGRSSQNGVTVSVQ